MTQGVIRFRLKDNVSDQKRRGYDFATGKEHALPSLLEIQTRFLEKLHADGFEPFDGDDKGFQYWRRKP